MGVAMIGIERKDRLQAGTCLVQLSLAPQQHGEIVTGIDMIGVERNRRLKAGECLVQFSLPLQQAAELVMGVAVIRIQGNGISIAGGGLCQLALSGLGGSQTQMSLEQLWIKSVNHPSPCRIVRLTWPTVWRSSDRVVLQGKCACPGSLEP